MRAEEGDESVKDYAKESRETPWVASRLPNMAAAGSVPSPGASRGCGADPADRRTPVPPAERVSDWATG